MTGLIEWYAAMVGSYFVLLAAGSVAAHSTGATDSKVLRCPPGYGFTHNLTGSAYTNYPAGYKGGALCVPCESGFYSPGAGLHVCHALLG